MRTMNHLLVELESTPGGNRAEGLAPVVKLVKGRQARFRPVSRRRSRRELVR